MDLNTALIESITSMSDYFVAANTRASFNDLAESVSNNSMSSNSTSNNLNNITDHNLGANSSLQSNQVFNNSSSIIQKQHSSTNQIGVHQQHNQQLPNNSSLNSQNGSNNTMTNYNPVTPCNQNLPSSGLNHQHLNNHHSSSSSTCSAQPTRMMPLVRTQIPIHCYIEQFDICADVPSYQSTLNDNDLFQTTDLNDPDDTLTNHRTQNLNSSNNANQIQPHLNQSMLALESVTNCNGGASSLSSIPFHSNSLFDESGPSENNNDFETKFDRMTDSPLSIHTPQTSDPSSSTNGLDQTSNNCADPLDSRQPLAYYESNQHLHSCKETYVIVTSNVLFIDLVRTVLLQLGYTATDLINAKGKCLTV